MLISTQESRTDGRRRVSTGTLTALAAGLAVVAACSTPASRRAGGPIAEVITDHAAPSVAGYDSGVRRTNGSEAQLAVLPCPLHRGRRRSRSGPGEWYRAIGAEDAERLIATIEATAPQLGWGRWRIAREAVGLALEVANSPFAAGHGPSRGPVCAPIAGMLAAVAGLVAGVGMEARESACAAQGAPRCRFRAAPA